MKLAAKKMILVKTVAPLTEEDGLPFMNTVTKEVAVEDTTSAIDGSFLSRSLLSLTSGEDSSSAGSVVEDGFMNDFIPQCVNVDRIGDNWATVLGNIDVFGPIPWIIGFLLCLLVMAIFQESMGFSEFIGSEPCDL